jgi:hydroxylysine kinase
MALSADDLRFKAPNFHADVLRRAALELFGIRGELLPLIGERDQNTLITTDGGEQFVLKVSGAHEKPRITELQTQALLHLERTARDLPVPRIVRNRDGLASERLIAPGGNSHVIRLLTHVPGITFDDASAISDEDLQAIGNFQGRVCRALASFRHPAARHFMPWDISNGLVVDEELWSHAEQDTQEIAGPARERLATSVLPAMTRLRSQIIHGDAHAGNVLRPSSTSHRVSGLIDFGDMHEAPLVVDLAIMAAGFSGANDCCLSTAVSLARGFGEVIALSSDEIGQLYDLILARHVLGLLLFDFQISTHSGETEVVLRDRPSAVLSLRRWLEIDPSELSARLRRVLTTGGGASNA